MNSIFITFQESVRTKKQPIKRHEFRYLIRFDESNQAVDFPRRRRGRHHRRCLSYAIPAPSTKVTNFQHFRQIRLISNSCTR